MTPPKRIVRTAPRAAPSSSPPKPAAPEPAPAPAARTPPRAPARRVIPIKASGELPKREQAQEAKEKLEGGNAVNYKAVVERYKGKVTNRASAIRAHCIECCCGVVSEVRACTVEKCALFPFRMGDDPFRKKRTDGFVGANKNEESNEGED